MSDIDNADRGIEFELTQPGLSETDPVGTAALADVLEITGNNQTTKTAADGVLFVTPDGAWVRERSREFLIALGDSDADYDASLFAVKNLGFIAVDISAKSFVEIKLHPRNITSEALSSIQRWLPSLKPVLFRINYLKGNWISETASSAAETICRLSELCAQEGPGVTHHEFSPVIH